MNKSECYQIFVHVRGVDEDPPTTLDGYNATCTLPMSDNRMSEIIDLAYNKDKTGSYL